MPEIIPQNDEDKEQLTYLRSPPGERGSGAVRYAAAMYFFQRGMLHARDLEAYRALSKVDGTADNPAGQAIMQLAMETERYISGLEFPGKADVMDGLARWMRGAPQAVKPGHVPARSHAREALAAMTDTRLASALASAVPVLGWSAFTQYPADEIGAKFLRNNAFASLVGEGSPYPAEDFDLGFFVVGPHTFYRDHCHAAPELYAPLTGPHGWRFKPGDPLQWLDADVPVWNPPNQPHATMTGDVPFLAIYCWTRDVNEPARVLFSNDWTAIETQFSASSK
ncbi:dimethylsulfonioproprionate lyase family protein [Aestuariivirga litoralis]|uniref:dimethylsulfonioproprionate lyase family protein n=1 Tax=Aestuariivirga litoralis TaxID=2650924 RepID=UPI001AEE9EE2|nr:dimethylsulfonioproprionate lyase family protein [Aestuariivirga litoralis]MBG1230776.1 hypothetical protein [Aestuariivirga litoralis]